MSMSKRFPRNSPAEEAAIAAGIAADLDTMEVRPATMQPAHAVVPAIVEARLRRRGPQRQPTKTPVSLRLDGDVLERLKATGPGWQTRVNALLRKALEA